MRLHGLQSGVADRNAGAFWWRGLHPPQQPAASFCRACSPRFLLVTAFPPNRARTRRRFPAHRSSPLSFSRSASSARAAAKSAASPVPSTQSFSRLFLGPQTIRHSWCCILRRMQIEAYQKRPEPQILLSGRIFDATSDLATRRVGPSRIEAFLVKQTHARGRVCAAADESAATAIRACIHPFLMGTEGSNPSPSSRESVSRVTLSSWSRTPAFRAGLQAAFRRSESAASSA